MLDSHRVKGLIESMPSCCTTVNAAMHKDVLPNTVLVRSIHVQVDLEVAKVDVSYIDSFVKTHGFVAW